MVTDPCRYLLSPQAPPTPRLKSLHVFHTGRPSRARGRGSHLPTTQKEGGLAYTPKKKPFCERRDRRSPFGESDGTNGNRGQQILRHLPLQEARPSGWSNCKQCFNVTGSLRAFFSARTAPHVRFCFYFLHRMALPADNLIKPRGGDDFPSWTPTDDFGLMGR